MLSPAAQEEGSEVERAGVFSSRFPHVSRFHLWKTPEVCENAVKRGGWRAQERRNEEGLTIKTQKGLLPCACPAQRQAVHCA